MGHSRQPSQTFLKRGGKARHTTRHDGPSRRAIFFWQPSWWPSRQVVWRGCRCQLFKNFQKSIVMQCFSGWRTVKTGVWQGVPSQRPSKRAFFLRWLIYIFITVLIHVFPTVFSRHFRFAIASCFWDRHKMEVRTESENLTFSVHVPDVLFLADKEQVHLNQFIPALWMFMGLSKQRLQKQTRKKLKVNIGKHFSLSCTCS